MKHKKQEVIKFYELKRRRAPRAVVFKMYQKMMKKESEYS